MKLLLMRTRSRSTRRLMEDLDDLVKSNTATATNIDVLHIIVLLAVFLIITVIPSNLLRDIPSTYHSVNTLAAGQQHGGRLQ